MTYRTGQEKIDQLTMQISASFNLLSISFPTTPDPQYYNQYTKHYYLLFALQNPNVIGSGYIEHPPQRPFADRVLVQPPTIEPEEIPDWYDSHGVLHHGPRPGAGGRGQQGYGQRGGYGGGREYQSAQRHGGGGGGGVPGYHAPAPRQQQQHHQQQPRPHHHQQPRPAAPPRPAVQPGVYDTSSIMSSLQQQQQHQHNQHHQPHRPAAPAPAPRPAPTPAAAPVEEKKLSKSAKAKLRKKMRETNA